MEKEWEILVLLRQGKDSQRAIARMVGVARGTVAVVARVGHVRRRARAQREWPSGPIERCPGCGALVEMPCKACLLRAQIESVDESVDRSDGDQEVGLDLKQQHYARYLRVRRRLTEEDRI